MVHQRLPHGKEVIINHRSVYLNRNDRSRRNGFYHKPMVPGIREPTVAVIASHFPLSRRCYVRMYGACGEIGALISWKCRGWASTDRFSTPISQQTNCIPRCQPIGAEENRVILKYSLLWIPMIFIAILNGALREFVLAKKFSELRPHQLSCLTGVLLFGAYTWLISLKWPLQSTKQAMAAGLVWLMLTVAFEFVFGRYVARHSWDRLFQDYNIIAGRLWVLVLLGVTLLPTIVFKLRP